MSAIPPDLSRLRHDLRTPLNHLLGYCDLLLEDDSLPGEFRPELDRIRSGGQERLEAVSGVPEVRADHATAAADLALDLTAFSESFASRTGHSVVLRIGIHSGPVVAGIIGRHRFSYDLWGDTVNTASRMESHGAPGRIHVSSVLRNRLAKTHRFEERGIMSIKGKGEMSTWFLLGRHHDDH